MVKIVDTVEDGIQSAILTATDNHVTPGIELAVKSIKPFSGQDDASVTPSSECEERIGVTASFENVSEKRQYISYNKSD